MCGWGPASCKADVQPYGVSRRRSEGRFQCQICHDARAMDDDVNAVETHEMLYVFYKAIRMVEASAPRFRVESSELLVFDNWRVMHGREPCKFLNNCMTCNIFAQVGNEPVLYLWHSFRTDHATHFLKQSTVRCWCRHRVGAAVVASVVLDRSWCAIRARGS